MNAMLPTASDVIPPGPIWPLVALDQARESELYVYIASLVWQGV